MRIGGSGKQEVKIVPKFQAQVDSDDVIKTESLGVRDSCCRVRNVGYKVFEPPQNAEPHPVVILKKSLSDGLLFASKTYKNSWVLCR